MKKNKKTIDDLALDKNVISKLNSTEINGGLNACNGAQEGKLEAAGWCCCLSVCKITKGDCIQTLGDPGCKITISFEP